MIFLNLFPASNIHAVSFSPHHLPVTPKQHATMLPREVCSSTHVSGGKRYLDITSILNVF
jgi:hypothetical protein